MSLNLNTFSIHDLSQFPFVLFRQEQAGPGYAAQWETEMLALLEHAQPFVLVYDQLRTDESHEDRKHRGLWLKHNKQALGHVCRAMISVEPNPSYRQQVQAMAEGAVKAFGIPHIAVASITEAKAVMQRLLTGLQPVE